MTPNQTHNAWTIEPPPGCRFVNQFGGEVTLYFPRGREKEIHDHIIKAVHAAFKALPPTVFTAETITAATAPGAAPSAPAPSAPRARASAPTPAPLAPPQGVPAGMRPVTTVVKMQDGSEATVTNFVPLDPVVAPALADFDARLAAAPLNPHPLDALAGSQGVSDEDEIAALLGDTHDTLPPPASLTRCAFMHAIDAEHEVQCTLKPHGSGMHAVNVAGVFYPMSLAPREVWTKRGEAPAAE